MAFNIAKDGTVTITATAFHPRVAVDLANTYVEVLLSRSSSFARQQARGTRELLENLLTQAKASQGEAEQSLRSFQSQRGGSVKLPDEARVDLQRLSQLEASLSDVQVSREIAQGRLAYLKGARPAGPAALDPIVAPLRERLATLEAKLASLARSTRAASAGAGDAGRVQEAQERLRSALQPQQNPRPAGVAALKPAESAQLSKQMAELEVEVISLQTRESGIQSRISRLKQSMSAMGAREQEYVGLSRAVENQAKLAAMLSDKLTGARISEQSQIRGIQVIDPASLPRRPSPKQPLKLIGIGLLAGLGLGLGAALLREFMTQVIESSRTRRPPAACQCSARSRWPRPSRAPWRPRSRRPRSSSPWTTPCRCRRTPVARSERPSIVTTSTGRSGRCSSRARAPTRARAPSC
jgi:uncharacterized protein involved in exopolysaccharide biosynthesis